MALKVTPNCRYGHGDLLKVEEGDKQQWGYVSPITSSVMFLGVIFVCKTCGYTEFFDDEIEVTVQRSAENERS